MNPLKKILSITARDIKVDFRQAMALYMLLVPFILAFVLKAFIPAAGGATINVAVLDSTSTVVVEHLEKYASVENRFKDENSIRSRVRQTDDIFGIIQEGGSFRVIEQGNESEGTRELLSFLLDSFGTDPGEDIPVKVTISDIGWKLSPLKQYGGSFLVIFMSVIGGMLIALNLIEEKMYNTMAALNVSPVSKSQIVLGKAIPGFVLPVFHSIGTLLILDFGRINYAQIILVVLSIAVISVIIGFTVGVSSSDPISGIASLKTVFLPVVASVFGAIFLNDKWHFILYWSPFYWAFRSIDGVIMKTATWSGIIMNSLIILALACVVFIILGKKIRRGLT